MKKNRYFWIVCMTPTGSIVGPWKGIRTPLHKQEQELIRQGVARECSLASGGMLVPDTAICVINAIEMDAEAAESYFPDDFKPAVVVIK